MKCTIKIYFWLLTIAITIVACQPNNDPKTFEVSGTFTNTVSKKIFLAELPFGSSKRTIVDTAAIDAKGNFALKTISKGEGIYQLFIENGPGVMLINDADKIEVRADAKNFAGYTTSGSKVNEDMKAMFKAFTQADSIYRTKKIWADSLQKSQAKDSVLQAVKTSTDASLASIKKILNEFVAAQPNGTAVYFATRMARQFNNQTEWDTILQTALKRFPNHPGLQYLL